VFYIRDTFATSSNIMYYVRLSENTRRRAQVATLLFIRFEATFNYARCDDEISSGKMFCSQNLPIEKRNSRAASTVCTCPFTRLVRNGMFWLRLGRSSPHIRTNVRECITQRNSGQSRMRVQRAVTCARAQTPTGKLHLNQNPFASSEDEE